MRPWIQYAALFSFGFLSGVIATGLALRNSAPTPPPHSPDEVLDRLSSKLHLTDDQRDKVSNLISQELPKGQALHQETHLKFRALRVSFDDQLRLILDPQQRQTLDHMESQWEHPERARVSLWTYHWSMQLGGPRNLPSPTITPR